MYKHLSNAKAALGVWSEAGLEETRGMFWKQYESAQPRRAARPASLLRRHRR